jgi:AAA domain
MAAHATRYDWFPEPEVTTPWLVNGLIPADGYTAIVGKPKAGKSTFLRNLIVATVKGHNFIGRKVDLPPNTGRVLYLHLDRKDKPGRVSAQLKKLGIKQDAAPRITMRLAEHLPSGKDGKDFKKRLEWLKDEVIAAKPNLIVIDLLWQFVIAKNSNDYNAVLEGINDLQDALINVGYKGALIVTMHGRKATNPNDQFDDFLGSTGQRGSFSTNIMLTQYKRDQLRTISSDQTDIEPGIGEIPETVITQSQDGTLALGQPISLLQKAEKQSKQEADIQRFLIFVDNHPGCGMEDIIQGLHISDRKGLELYQSAQQLVSRIGRGKKGDPHRYYPAGYEMPTDAKPLPETQPVETKGATNGQTN